MLTSALQTKWIMQLMVLVYLLLSFGTANAAFWCQTDESSSHLKVNPIGKCWENCSSDDGGFQQGFKISQSARFSLSQGEDCHDFPVITSALLTSKPTSLLNKSLESSCGTLNLPHVPELNVKIKGLVNHSRPVYLPEPQTLKILRTVVLLR